MLYPRAELEPTSIYNRRGLVMLKSRALRRNVWFRALSTLERGLINSVIQTVRRVRSPLLVKVLFTIVKKLTNALETRVTRMTREIGKPLANRISLLAQAWGNISAVKWSADRRFIRFLTVISMNASSTKRFEALGR